jgi:Ferritin-like domain
MEAFSFKRLDVDGALSEAADRAGLMTRGSFVAGALGASAVAAIGGSEAAAQGGAPGPNDQAILNYALTLEYLQAAFYTEAERLKALEGKVAEAARKLGSVERAHVQAFRDVLGPKAVKRPQFDFQGVTEMPRPFLKTAVAFEDLAVAAYGGQAARLRADTAVAAAVSIYSVEARHAAWMRYLFGLNPAARAFDPPKSKAQITRVVASTNFIAQVPDTERKRAPRFTG